MCSVDKKARLYYHRLPDFDRKETKLDFLSDNSLESIDWQRLVPNQKHTWRRTDTEDEFAAYLPIGSKEAKRAKTDQAETIFKTYSGGVKTNRDTFVFDFDLARLQERMQSFVEHYNSNVDRLKRSGRDKSIDDFVSYDQIKWDGTLKSHLIRFKYGAFDPDYLRSSLYRPFTRKHLYFDRLFINRVYLLPSIFPDKQSETDNRVICCTDVAYRSPSVSSFIVNSIPGLSICSTTDGHQCFPFYTYDEDGSNRRENITDYALDQFRIHYNDPAISKWDIFYYVYGLLHHPGYRERYALDLKRSLPRIPFAPSPHPPAPSPKMREGELGNSELANGDESPLPLYGGGGLGVGVESGFHAFSRAGAQLADLHLNYESADRYELEWVADRSPPSYRVEKMLPKGKVDSAEGNYKVYETLKYNDTLTLHGIPERAFAYRLGNRSALDWIVDQYRVKTDKRSGITHDPNGYSDDPQYILKLIERVITVSLRTVDIVEGLAKLPFRDESADE